jgi:uncharacterized protein
MEISLAGEALSLLPTGAIFWHDAQTLLVADVHLGKGDSFRKAGIPIFERSTAQDLALLTAHLQTLPTRRIVFLGDLIHARCSKSPEMLAEVTHWRQSHPALEITLVRGNHDRRAGDPPASWCMECVNEPLIEGPWAFRHYPDATPGHYTLAGHIHPALMLSGRGRQKLKLPVFHIGPKVGLLPAFGSLTGLAVITPQPDDRLYVIAETEIMDVSSIARLAM